jgi:putative YhbY family RNA-binding protein
MLTLSPGERRAQRARAHRLTPVVMISAAGPGPAVIAEVERALAAHELIKIRAFSDERDERDAWLNAICESVTAAPVQHIGKVLVIYRPRPPQEKRAVSAKRPPGPRKTKKQMLGKTP